VGSQVASRSSELDPGKSPPAPKPRINLQRASILIIDTQTGIEILRQVFFAFGARTIYHCKTFDEAKEILATSQIDLVVVEALLGEEDAYDLVRNLRRRGLKDLNRFTPLIVLSAHTASGKVARARDCGANFFVAKPVSPRTLMERLLWVAKEDRQFVQTDTYSGPDRRFHDHPLPAGQRGRRREDLEAEAHEQEPAA
jgi:DNA-binding response OmpR family regulator